MNNRDRLAAPRESFCLSISNNGDRLAAPRRDRRSEGYFASMLMIARASYDDVCAIAFALTHAAALWYAASRNSTFEIRLINPRRACARVTVVVCLCSRDMHRSYDITLTACEHAPTQLFLCVVLAVQHVRQMIGVQTTHSRNTQTSHTNMNSALHQHKKHNRAGGSLHRT